MQKIFPNYFKERITEVLDSIKDEIHQNQCRIFSDFGWKACGLLIMESYKEHTKTTTIDLNEGYNYLGLGSIDISQCKLTEKQIHDLQALYEELGRYRQTYEETLEEWKKDKSDPDLEEKSFNLHMELVDMESRYKDLLYQYTGKSKYEYGLSPGGLPRIVFRSQEDQDAYQSLVQQVDENWRRDVEQHKTKISAEVKIKIDERTRQQQWEPRPRVIVRRVLDSIEDSYSFNKRLSDKNTLVYCKQSNSELMMCRVLFVETLRQHFLSSGAIYLVSTSGIGHANDANLLLQDRSIRVDIGKLFLNEPYKANGGGAEGGYINSPEQLEVAVRKIVDMNSYVAQRLESVIAML